MVARLASQIGDRLLQQAARLLGVPACKAFQALQAGSVFLHEAPEPSSLRSADYRQLNPVHCVVLPPTVQS